MTYSAFGTPLEATNTSSPFLFAGRPWDSETGTYNNRARQYDPTTGRFLSEDPLAADNLYRYGNNNPGSFTDPTGWFSVASETEGMEQRSEIERIHMHHSFPREILKGLKNAGNQAHKASKVRGRAKCVNRVPVEAKKHLRDVHRGRGGGAYNEGFKERVKRLTGLDDLEDAYGKIEVEQLLKIRVEMLELFDIVHPGCV